MTEEFGIRGYLTAWHLKFESTRDEWVGSAEVRIVSPETEEKPVRMRWVCKSLRSPEAARIEVECGEVTAGFGMSDFGNMELDYPLMDFGKKPYGILCDGMAIGRMFFDPRSGEPAEPFIELRGDLMERVCGVTAYCSMMRALRIIGESAGA